jgi:hypothetical protein
VLVGVLPKVERSMDMLRHVPTLQGPRRAPLRASARGEQFLYLERKVLQLMADNKVSPCTGPATQLPRNTQQSTCRAGQM